MSGTIYLVLQVTSRRTAARITRSVGIAVLTLIGAVAIGFASTISTALQLLATTALVMTGTFTSTPDQAYLDMAENQFVVPALGDHFDPYLPVTTPEQAWPITGLFDYTFGRSVAIGVGDLETAMDGNGFPNEPLLIFGYSQSSVISIIVKRKLAEYYAEHPELDPPEITFVCIGCLNLPNGGVMARYPGAYIPFINFYFNGAAPTDTPFDTVMITNRWDGFADSPLYPLWLPSTVNGVLGMVYAHTEYDEWTLEPEYSQGTFGDTTYYFLPNDKLPLFGPARSLGVPEEIIDIFEPFFVELVELGYDRSIPPWEPTPARLIPRIDPFTAIPKLIGGIEEGIDNAIDVFGSPPPLTIPAPVSSAARSTFGAEAPAALAPAGRELEEPVGDQPASNNEGVIATTTPEDIGSPQPASNRATMDRQRPTLRGPAGFFGPRIRDVLHRVRNGLPAATSTEGAEVTSSSPEDSPEGATPSSADGS